MYVPNLAKTASTDPTFPPFCSGAIVRRQPPGAKFLWTLTLVWDLSAPEGLPTLPAPFSHDTGEIVLALAGDGPAYSRKSLLQAEVQCRVDVRVGKDKLPIFRDASAIVKSIQVTASKGAAECKVLLVVEAPRNLAPEFLDCIDADVDVHTITNSELPYGKGGKAADEPEAGDHERGDPDGDADPPSNGDAPAETLTQARARRRRGTATEPASTGNLPPEA